MDIRINAELDGMSVKQILFGRLGLSAACVSRLKNLEDGIVLGGARVTVRAVVREGDLLSLGLEDRESEQNPAIEPVEMPLCVLYEDSDCIVVSKPGGMPTHPSHGHHGDTLANAMVAYYRSAGVPFVFRPVNRLDRETSGAVLIARGKAAAARLGAAMAHGMITKKYYAVLDGVPLGSEGTIEGYIERERESIIKRVFRESGSSSGYSLTRWRALASDGIHTLVEASPVTGRTHQLRVHFAHIGTPVSGDGLYGNGEGIFPGLALHAHRLIFPAADGTADVTAPMTGGMLAAVHSIKGDGLQWK